MLDLLECSRFFTELDCVDNTTQIRAGAMQNGQQVKNGRCSRCLEGGGVWRGLLEGSFWEEVRGEPKPEPPVTLSVEILE